MDKNLVNEIESSMLRDDLKSDDHLEKNNRTENELKEANEKMTMKTKTEAVPIVDTDKYVIKNGVKQFRRTPEDYELIWNAFVENAEPEFKEFMGYGKEEIEKIGIEKFIDTEDWRDASDIFSFKTDSVHVIPCVHCGKEFATFELGIGLCDNCAKFYDTTKFAQLVGAVAADKTVENINKGTVSANCIAEFVFNEDFRKKFLIEQDNVNAEDTNTDNILKTKWER